MRILVENSTWRNIGDAFYQSCLYSIFKNEIPSAEVAMTDGPIQRSFIPRRIFSKNAFDIRFFHHADLYCFSGPILGEPFLYTYGPLIRSIIENDGRYVLLSVHGNGSDNVVSDISGFLRKYPPVAFSTRDEQTFERFASACEDPYNGICTSFFASRLFPIIPVKMPRPYVCYSFYSRFEPKITWNTLSGGVIDLESIDIREYPTYIWRIARHFEWLRKLEFEFMEYHIVRPIHDIGYKYSHLNFAKPNSYLSYNPLTYLALYAGTTLTISDRVHACAVSLSFGKPSVLVGKWKRSDLFRQLPLLTNESGVMQIEDCNFINREYEKYVRWLVGRIKK